jgi:hypothetical protein
MKLLAASLALSLAPLAAYAQTPEHADGGMQAMHRDKPPVPPSKFLNVTYAGHTVNLKVEDLAALPQVTVHVRNAHSNQDEEYSGPLVADVLAKAGFTATHDTEPAVLHSAVVATATDRYFVVFSMAEIQPSFSRSQVIVAILKSGLPDTAGGIIQLINTDGAKPARWVHGLQNLNVMTLGQNP